VGAESKFLKPREGLLVRDPLTKAIIPATGSNLPWIGPAGRYWRRRVSCGDMILSEQAAPITIKTGGSK
jgi:hypothetical protein